MGKIIIAGIGPGSPEDITPAVLEAVREADAIVGYKYYFQFIEPFVREGCECIDTGMKKEQERAEQAFLLAEQGKTVVVISSGDAGIYGMAGLLFELADQYEDVDIEVVAGVTAANSGAAVLGAPIGHDFCLISLSDLLTPWEVIEKRLRCAAEADFAICLYNPRSKKRDDYLAKACGIMMEFKSPDTVCGWVIMTDSESHGRE